jgi:hypothetical protein
MISDPLGIMGNQEQGAMPDPLGLANMANTSLDSDKPTQIWSEPDKSWWQKTKTYIDDLPEKNIGQVGMDALEAFGGLFGDDSKENARSFDNYQVSKETGIPVNMVGERERIDYANSKGFYTQPEKYDFLMKLSLAPIAAASFTEVSAGYAAAGLYGAVAKAGGIAAGFGVFMGLAEAENYAVSKATDSKYQFGAGKGLAELSGDPEGPMSDVLKLTDLVGQAFATKGIMVGKDKAVSAFAENYMREVITKYKMPEKVYVSPAEFREFRGWGPESGLSVEQAAILKDLKMTKEDMVFAVKNGIDIEIPASRLVTIQDKPWVQSIKNLFKVDPYKTTTTEMGGEAVAKKPVAGLIEGQTQTIIPGEIVQPAAASAEGLVQIKGAETKYTPEMFPADTQLEVSRLKDGEIVKEKVPVETAIKELSDTKSMVDRLKAFKECIG